jgi:hypothetical protein
MTTPRIKDYITDGGEKWANLLYQSVTTAQQINLSMSRLIATHDMSLVNNTSTVLTCLQPSGELAAQYHKVFVCRPAMKLANDVVFTDPAEIKTWIGDMIIQFIRAYIHAPENPSQTQLRLQAVAKELQHYIEQAGTAAELGASATEFLIALRDLSFKNIVAAESKLAKYGPKVAGFFKVIAYAGGLLYAFRGFLEWDKLDNEGKAKTIVTTIMLAGQTAEALPSLILSVSEGFQKLSVGDWSKLEITFSDRDVLGSVTRDMEQVDRKFVANGADEIRAGFRAGGEIAGEATKWGKFFQNVNKALKWLGVAVAAAFAVISTIDFAKVLKDGSASDKEKAFTGIIAISALCETVCLALSLVLAYECIPFVGAVFAVIGIIFALVQMFEPQPKPESPVDKFMDNVVKPFLASWTPPVVSTPPAKAA